MIEEISRGVEECYEFSITDQEVAVLLIKNSIIKKQMISAWTLRIN